MRQAVVNVGADLLAARGLDFEVFQEAGIRDIEVLSCEGPRGVVRVHLEEPLATDRLDAMDAIEWWEEVSTEGEEYVYVVEAGHAAVEDATAPDDEPFPRCEHLQVTEEGLTLTWAGPQDRLHEELTRLDQAGTDVSLEQLRGYRTEEEPLDVLTGRQREVLEVALERGYYDVPRQSSVQEVAGAFDLDDSTVAEHLQRAERNLLRHLFDRAA